ncbi:NAD-glutamate dehydrogenase [Sphingomonas montanisoli]|uniref:NAD-glutamate dehydrogenase n=1 Tax=Sphingomonas montanisoli TaxID=2606412 RepID=A0A5D9CER5_9SPHN|nr:NAD-glutamate dehydrogenase domain-containing protein [Sphingomonas montanisoli]TZG29682.1 NAD-glutamate dehydrogenase [Sphingomonas montanisoli]
MNRPQDSALSPQLVARFAALLGRGALPGETEGMGEADMASAAAFAAETAALRAPGVPAIAIQSVSGSATDRAIRIVIVNDDMPFLVDSIAGVLTAHDIEIRRLLHPVIAVRRDATGALTDIVDDAEGERRESVIYVEADRIDARNRRTLVTELETTLAEVRAAVRDWQTLQVKLRDDAERLPDGEGAALLRWFLDGKMTLLGHRIETRDGKAGDPQGVLRVSDTVLWSDSARADAFAWFERGGAVPMLVKADAITNVHRRAALDMIVVPVRDGGAIAGLSIHVGLWTSAALRSPTENIPVLRGMLKALDEKLRFDPRGHAGKALRHAMAELPHDLALTLAPSATEQVVLTAMSLADRPRPKLEMVSSALGRHLIAFLWLPRDLLTTGRREQIGTMLAEATGGALMSYALQLGDGDLALIRYTLRFPESAALPDVAALDHRIGEMLRGWEPAVEARLAELLPARRSARLAIDYAAAFPAAYRGTATPADAAADIARLIQLDDEDGRNVRIYDDETEGDARLRLKIYRRGPLIPLSEAVPVLENFGFRVIEEVPTALAGIGHIHEFRVDLSSADVAIALLDRTDVVEAAIAATLEGRAENDLFNALTVTIGLAPHEAVLFRAWFRYLRQTGFSYGLATAIEALTVAPDVGRDIIGYFRALHDPKGRDDKKAEQLHDAIEQGLKAVSAIDNDRMLRRFRAVVRSTLRTNAFSPASDEALAFKIDSSGIPGLPQPVPWREIWVYSPRVEGIHLRGGPIARGGLRWSDRRDDFRTEILGLMKAQVVKNAVIVPTGAKGGFYPKVLPPASDRDAWLAEGTESYRIFIRALLSITDNIEGGKVVHPARVVIRDGEDPYFVVAADKGTATFSDVANKIATDRGFWLGDAFASGGGHGYDHKAMGITAKGAWVSVQRHFAEMGVDVQSDVVRVVGCGDMSGDVFGNGMLLSKTLKIVAAFDHRHIFLDPDPDPARSWAERERMFALPRSSWADYDTSLISQGGGIFPRDMKEIPLSAEVKTALGIDADVLDPSALIAAILKAKVDLLWFGGIGTYVKAKSQTNAEVGDRSNDPHRIDGEDVGARVIGEGANLGVTQAGRIAFATKGGRINTDFIDNSAGVDCSDNEVNIKIALNREMQEGRLEFEDRNSFLASMTDDVAHIVLEDNRLQTLALSLAERGGADAVASQTRVIDVLEASGRINRAVEGLDGNDLLLRRAQDGHGLTRPELAVILSHGKLSLQDAIENSDVPADAALTPMLHAAFPQPMQDRFGAAIDAHRLRPQIIATKLANRVINRLGLVGPFEMAEEEAVSMAQVAAAYITVDRLFDIEAIFEAIEDAKLDEQPRLTLFEVLGAAARAHVADLLRSLDPAAEIGARIDLLKPGLSRLDKERDTLLKAEAVDLSRQLRDHISADGVDAALVDRIARLAEMEGAIGTAALASELAVDELDVTDAYVTLGEALGLDWAKAEAARFRSGDAWDRLLVAGLVREFGQLRLDFLGKHGRKDPIGAVREWLSTHGPRVAQFKELVDRARITATPSAAMLAQIAAQARRLLAR